MPKKLLLAVLSAALFGCNAQSSILLTIDGDFVAAIESDELNLAMTSGDVTVFSNYELTTETPLPQSISILSGEAVTQSVVVEAAALLRSEELLSAKRAIAFDEGERVQESICLWKRCIGSEELDCVAGLCEEGDGDGDSDSDGDGDTDADGDSDGDGDADADGDSDGDGDADADGDSDGDGDTDSDADTIDCVEGESTCDGDEVRRCMDGSWITEDCELGCSGGRCLQLAPSNVDGDLMDLGSEDVVIDTSIAFDTDDCDPSALGYPGAYAEVVAVSGARDVCVVVMHSLTVESTGTLSTTGTNGLVLLSSGDVVIDGTISSGASGYSSPGPGGGFGGGPDEAAPTSNDCGGGPGTVETVTVPRNSGGGGGGHGGRGGRGGDALDGAIGGTAGQHRGNEELVPLTGGCGGGGGATEVGRGDGGIGGCGGGALQISAGGTLYIGPGGQVLAHGGGGQGGGEVAGGGGAGAGGGILLEGIAVIIDGAVSANGGGGGSAGGFDDTNDGADGTNDDTRAPGGASPGANAERGGRGGAGSDPDGETPPTESNTGGGGGAVGRIRVNTRDGTVSVGGTISPSTAGTFSVDVIDTM